MLEDKPRIWHTTRAGDMHRELAIDRLSHAFQGGYFNDDELKARISAATAATDYDDIRELTSDLPRELQYDPSTYVDRSMTVSIIRESSPRRRRPSACAVTGCGAIAAFFIACYTLFSAAVPVMPLHSITERSGGGAFFFMSLIAGVVLTIATASIKRAS